MKKNVDILETERLLLKPLQSDDDHFLFELHSDPEVMKFIRKPDQDIFQTKKRIHEILDYTKENPGLGLWNAFLKETGDFLGWVVLVHIEHSQKNPVEVGYRLHQKFWGKGYASEMAQKILEHAADLGLKKVCGITIDENIGSQKVLEKVGLTYKEDRIYYELQVRYYEIEL